MRPSAADLRRRAGEEAGFTLVELLAVLVVIGVLTGIAAVSYVGFREHSSRTTAESNVSSVIPALEAFHTDRDTYVGASLTVLRKQYDLQIDDSAASRYKISSETDSSYCIQNHVGDWYAWTTGPGAPIDTDVTSHC
jgi:prepilin-type N-terminal cleavage/methylation domain-containing protein